MKGKDHRKLFLTKTFTKSSFRAAEISEKLEKEKREHGEQILCLNSQLEAQVLAIEELKTRQACSTIIYVLKTHLFIFSLSSADANVSDKDKSLQALQQELASAAVIQTSLAEKDANLRKLSEEIEFLKMTRSTMQSELDRIPSLQQRIETLQGVESQLDAKNARIAQLIEDLSSLRIDHGILQANAESLKIKCAMVEELRHQLDTSKLSYQSASEACASLEKQKESAEQQARAAERAARTQETLFEEKYVFDLTFVVYHFT
jgi:chromosome segregation ATPase